VLRKPTHQRGIHLPFPERDVTVRSRHLSEGLGDISCQRSGAEFEGHSIEIPVGSVVPSELIVMMRHTLRTVNGIIRSSSRSNRRERVLVII
jgi:hypothetical protein